MTLMLKDIRLMMIMEALEMCCERALFWWLVDSLIIIIRLL